MALIALASRGGHQQKALFGDSFCIIFTLFMGRRMTNQSYKTPRILYDFDTIREGLKFLLAFYARTKSDDSQNHTNFV
jgi:hypothetical protein